MSRRSATPHGEPERAFPELQRGRGPDRRCAREIQPAMKRYPQMRSASIPALWAVQRRYGWCTPEGIRQAAAVMGVTPAYLESVASFYDLFHLEPSGTPPGARLHQHLLLAARRGRAAGRVLRGGRASPAGGRTSEDGKLFVRGFECLGACDIAPMASIDERYYGPLEPRRRRRGRRAARQARGRGAARQAPRGPRRRRRLAQPRRRADNQALVEQAATPPKSAPSATKPASDAKQRSRR